MTLSRLGIISLLTLALAACSIGITQDMAAPPPDDGDRVEPAALRPGGEDDPNRTVTSNDPPPTATPPLEGKMLEAEADVDSLAINILESFPVQVMLVVRGNLPSGCTVIGRSEQSGTGSNIILVRLYTARPAEAMCTQALVPFEKNIALDVVGLPAGEYIVDVNGVTASFRLDVDNSPPDMGPGVCPRGGVGKALLTNEEDGFCLLFPDDFSLRDDEAPGIVGFYGPPLDESLEPVMASLYVSSREPAGGKTVEQIADERRAAYEGTGIELKITPASLDSQPAIIIQGQGETARTLQIITVYNNRIYSITVTPYDQAFPQASEDVQRAWDLALESFKFIH